MKQLTWEKIGIIIIMMITIIIIIQYDPELLERKLPP